VSQFASEPVIQLAEERFDASEDHKSMRTFVLRDSIVIHAPLERCFRLSCDIAIVERELGMKAVEGRTEGLVTGGDVIRWEGWQLGFWHYHVSLISLWQPPVFFQDRMIAGRFRSFEHDHRLTETEDGVLLSDELRFEMLLDEAGWVVGRTVLVPHIRGLMRKRFRLLKKIAESEEWRRYLEA
jgi:ligand-binding SRPBCC domain-containing protein